MAKREVRYINKDFDSFNDELKKYLVRYFPDTFSDFNEAAAGTAFIELTAYVGDVLSFYMDRQFNELYLNRAIERKNIISLAETLGYMPRGKAGAVAPADLTIKLPTTVDLSTQPVESTTGNSLSAYIDTRLLPKVKAGSIFLASDSSSTPFEVADDVDFQLEDNRTLVRYNNNEIGIVKTQNRLVAGMTKTFQQNVGTATRFREIILPDSDVLEILSVRDSDDNEWYEVDYLARSNTFVGKENVDPSSSADTNFTMTLKPIPRRFIKRRTENGRIKLVFGAGTKTIEDEEFIPSPEDFILPNTVRGSVSGTTPAALDPTDLLETKTLGVAPENTTITIAYRIGGGLRTNVATGTITQVFKKTLTFPSNDTALRFEQDVAAQSLMCVNTEPASGGEDEETLDQLRHNASAFFATQGRVVTMEDYSVRALTMPANFGAVYRARARRNPYNNTSMQLFVLSRNQDGELVNANNVLKSNIALYLDKFRLANESLEILDGQIINVAIDFIITTNSGHNRTAVLASCLDACKLIMHRKNFTFGTNLIYSDLQNAIHDNPGVRSVVDVKIYTITNTGYSPVAFNVAQNTANGEIQCPEDSIFEVKFPNLDITGVVA